MSNPYAISAVTLTLRNLLVKHVSGEFGGAKVTMLPPDLARENQDGRQLNLFLYQTAINPGWRNMDIPQRVKPGEAGRPPLALNLDYLLTAYGPEERDEVAHELLGHAMHAFNDHALLMPKDIQDALANGDLHLQIERVRLTPVALTLEELSKLWTVFQTEYRISVAYRAAVVLIESTAPVRAAPPVLTRGDKDIGVVSQTDLVARFPTLEDVFGQRAGQKDRLPSVRLRDELVLRGHHLGETAARVLVRITKPRLDRKEAPVSDYLIPPDQRTATEIRLRIPPVGEPEPRYWPAGFYRAVVVIQPAGAQPDQHQETNEVSFTLAPNIARAPSQAPPGQIELRIGCVPRVELAQRVALLFGSRVIAPLESALPNNRLRFRINDVTAGNYLVRLRVDGVDSLPVQNYSTRPPKFDPGQIVEVT